MGDRVYVVEIGERAVLCFPAEGFQEAQSLLKEDWLRADLREHRSEGKPLWDGIQRLRVRNANEAETARFNKEAKPLEDDDLPIVYLVTLDWCSPIEGATSLGPLLSLWLREVRLEPFLVCAHFPRSRMPGSARFGWG